MECFYHKGTAACGICKSCQRGICSGCASEVKNGIACLNRCEQQATEIDDMIEASKQNQEKSTALIKSIGLGAGDTFNIILGALFLGFGLYEGKDFIAYLGVAFLAFGLWGILRVIKAKRDGGA